MKNQRRKARKKENSYTHWLKKSGGKKGGDLNGGDRMLKRSGGGNPNDKRGVKKRGMCGERRRAWGFDQSCGLRRKMGG